MNRPVCDDGRVRRSTCLITCLVACYAPSPPQGRPCGANGACPAELVCRGGTCVAEGAGVDASGADATVDALDDGGSDAPSIDAPIDGPPQGCPSSYTAVAGQSSRYRTNLTPRTWTDAEADCEDDGVGTHLAVVDTMAEHTAVDALTGASIWFGLTDRVVEGTPRWVTGATPSYTNYGPADNAPDYDCAGIYQGAWAWGECATLIKYVCECDGIPAQVGAY